MPEYKKVGLKYCPKADQISGSSVSVFSEADDQ